jgi:hypothetical protein
MSDSTDDDGPDDPKVTRLDRRRRPPPPGVSPQPPDLREQRAKMLLGPECPYLPLGHDEGTYWVLDRDLVVRGLKPRDLSRNMMVSLAGEKWLEARYPRTRKRKKGQDIEVYGLAAEKAAAELMEACSVMGHWQPDDAVRGLGAWPGADGDLVLHRGDHLVIRGVNSSGVRVAQLGLHSNFVYVPRRPLPSLPTGTRAQVLVDNAAREILQKLDTFRWGRGVYDSSLCLGWICCAILGAALKEFRPHGWIGAEFGAGKTTLQTYLTALFSAAGIVSVTDASAAGLWQAMGYDCIPIGVDEIEASADPDRQLAIVKLLRQASSGALILRGGAGHRGASFTVRSAFLCSSIVIPPLASQDASRIVRLELIKDPPGVHRAPFSIEAAAEHGAALTLRLALHYPRFIRDVLPVARQMMIADGFSARTADLYSTLWAAYDVVLFDTFSPVRLTEWLRMRPTVLMKEHMEQELTPEWRRCVDHLSTSRTDRVRAESDTFGELVGKGVKQLLRPSRVLVQATLFDDDGEEIAVSGDEGDKAAFSARNRLARFGLQLRRVVDEAGEIKVQLVIANAHRALAEVFAGTVWRTLPEAATGGGWAQVLRRAPGAQMSLGPMRFRGGVKVRAVILPIELMLGDPKKPEKAAWPVEEPGEEDLRQGEVPMH